MPSPEVDVVVIGGGPGGYTAAIRAAQLKLSTTIVERDRLGGICLNWGCVPTKALLKNAELVQHMQHAAEWGITTGPLQVDFPKVIQRSRGVADRLSKGVEFLMKKNGITALKGTARLTGKGGLTVTSAEGEKTELRARSIIMATGARPRMLPGVPFDHTRILTSTDAMTLQRLPASMIIIGAGAIGVEFAYFYRSLGTAVTLVEMQPSILPIEDREITKELERALRKQGMTIATGSTVERVTTGPEGVTVAIKNESGSSSLTAEVALVAIGVQGNVEDLGLEACGVTVERGRIVVDARYQTSAPGIFAIGDVIGPPWLAHVASAEGVHCVEGIAGLSPEPVDYTSIPGCTYCQPQVASIGLTEEKAREAGKTVKIGKFPFRALGKAVAAGETDGMVKLIFDATYGELLGAHIVGADATELIMELLIAKRHEATATSIAHAVHAHPTLSEAIMEAAAAAEGVAINI